MEELSSVALTESREAFNRRDWSAAFAGLRAADADHPLKGDDLERLGTAAHLVGLDRDSADAWSRAHRDYLDRGDVKGAARAAFWLGFLALIIDADLARSSGWQTRGQRLLEDAGLDCVESGYLAMLPAIRCLFQGDFSGALAGIEHAARFGERFHDSDLLAICRLGTGQVRVRTGQITDGMALLDEVMVALTAGDVSPVFAGIAYCAVIQECQFACDIHRARVWTEALNQWSAVQPGLVPYRRQCLAHRAEVLRWHGAWAEAQAEAARACEMVSQVPDHLSTGEAWYERGEIHRLRGEPSLAEEAYRQAGRLGRSVNPGLALLRLAQGQGKTAASSLRRELNETPDTRPRAFLLDALVEVLLVSGDSLEARRAADELTELARDLHTPLLSAMALRARGATAMAEGDARGSLSELRQAWKAWFELEAPYEAARVRVLIGLCCRELGDPESADLELDAALQIFSQLGAVPDLARVRVLRLPSNDVDRHGLSARELEVLRLVVAGKTNHAIAGELVVSDHTVRRHVQNIFAKLGVSSRAAATAFALQHDLI